MVLDNGAKKLLRNWQVYQIAQVILMISPDIVSTETNVI